MPYLPAIPVVPDPAVEALIRDGFMGVPLVEWPRGRDHRPRVRLLLRCEGRDAAGAAHAFLKVATVSLAGTVDLVAVASAEVNDFGTHLRAVDYFDDGDGLLFSAPAPTASAGVAREAALRELNQLAARLLAPDPAALREWWNEPFAAAVRVGCPVVGIGAAASLPTADALRAAGTAIVETQAGRQAADAVLAIYASYAWTGTAIATPAPPPHWNVTCTPAGQVRLACRHDLPREQAPGTVGVCFALDEGDRAMAFAKGLAGALGTRTVSALGRVEIKAPLPVAYDGAAETARNMAGPLRTLLKDVRGELAGPAGAAADAILSEPLRVRNLPVADWWNRWHALSAALPAAIEGETPGIRRLRVVREALDRSGYGAPLARVPAPRPLPPAPPGRRPARPRKPPPPPEPPAGPLQLAYEGLEFSVLAKAESDAGRSPQADLVRDVAGLVADLMPVLATGGEAYSATWQAAMQAGIALRDEAGPEALRRLSDALAALFDTDPDAFPDEAFAARWAMELRRRMRAVRDAALSLSVDVAEPPPEPAVRSVTLTPPPPRVPSRPTPEPAPPVATHPAPAPAEPVPVLAPGIGPEAPPPPAPVEPEPKPAPAAGRPPPTKNGWIVVRAMEGREALRKTDIAELSGIGRGAANRTVDRLVADGWMVAETPTTYRLVPPG